MRMMIKLKTNPLIVRREITILDIGSNFKNAYSICSISNNEKYLAYGSYKNKKL